MEGPRFRSPWERAREAYRGSSAGLVEGDWLFCLSGVKVAAGQRAAPPAARPGVGLEHPRASSKLSRAGRSEGSTNLRLAPILARAAFSQMRDRDRVGVLQVWSDARVVKFMDDGGGTLV